VHYIHNQVQQVLNINPIFRLKSSFTSRLLKLKLKIEVIVVECFGFSQFVKWFETLNCIKSISNVSLGFSLSSYQYINLYEKK
jgi:hypothetical protein